MHVFCVLWHSPKRGKGVKNVNSPTTNLFGFVYLSILSQEDEGRHCVEAWEIRNQSLCLEIAAVLSLDCWGLDIFACLCGGRKTQFITP